MTGSADEKAMATRLDVRLSPAVATAAATVIAGLESIARRGRMNEEGRREISEWVTLLALLLALSLAPLPFVTGERYFRVLPASLALIFPLIMLLGTLFPRGLRLPLGRWSLRIAPPAVYFVTYYRLCRWLEKERARFVWTADELADLQRGQDDMTRDIQHDAALSAAAIGLTKDEAAALASALFLQVYTDGDAALAARCAAAIDKMRTQLGRPAAATTAGLWDQIMDLSDTTARATALTRARLTFQVAFIKHTLPKALGMAGDVLARLEQRSQAEAAQIAAIEAEVAALTQSGRRGRGRPKGSGYWTDDNIRALHAEYVNRGTMTSNDFAKSHKIDKSHMLKCFQKLGLSAEP